MTDNGYLIWMIATAVMTVAVLTIGTLAAAGLLRRERPTEDPADDLRARRDHERAAPTRDEHQKPDRRAA